jgi:hypothetical protein
MKRIHKIRVDSLEPSTKFESKWVAHLSLDGKDSSRFFMSEKQMNGLKRGLDAPLLFAAFDYEKAEQYGSPRFIWAATDRAWLEKAFLNSESRPAPVAPPVAEKAKPSFAEMTASVKLPADPAWLDEELPF